MKQNNQKTIDDCIYSHIRIDMVSPMVDIEKIKSELSSLIESCLPKEKTANVRGTMIGGYDFGYPREVFGYNRAIQEIRTNLLNAGLIQGEKEHE